MHHKTEQLIVDTITGWVSGLPGQALPGSALAALIAEIQKQV